MGLTVVTLTPAQQRRLVKKIRKNDVAYVRCEGCGWVGFDHHDPSDPDVTPCPECSHLYARYAIDY